MNLEVFDDSGSVTQAAAATIAAEARAALAEHGRFTLAVSGRHTPWIMLRALAEQDISWDGVHVVQIDERVAPDGHPDRNLTHLRESFLQQASLRPEHIHAMRVESPDLGAAAREYGEILKNVSDPPPVLDPVHMGLGSDGHTKSLVPGDAVLGVMDVDVGLTQTYKGRRRMTLTYPAINRARHRLWMVIGSDKKPMLQRLRNSIISIPAGRVNRQQAVVMAARAGPEQRATAGNLSG